MDGSPLDVRPLDDSRSGRFTPGTICPMHVDVLPSGRFAPERFAPELSVLGVSPSRCGRTDGRFDVKPLALASEVKSLTPWLQWESLARDAKVKKHLTSEAKAKGLTSKEMVRGLTSYAEAKELTSEAKDNL